MKGLSDRAIAWIFVAPTIFLLLAVKHFPLIWTINLSFTDYRANRPNREVEFVGLRNYERILTGQRPSSGDDAGDRRIFFFWTIFLPGRDRLSRFANLINQNFQGLAVSGRRSSFLPMMLSSRGGGEFLDLPLPAPIGLLQLAWSRGSPGRPLVVLDDRGQVQPSRPWADRHRRYLDVDALRDCSSASRGSELSRLHLRPPDRQAFEMAGSCWTITVPMVATVPDAAVLFRGIENFKMFDLVVQADRRGPGSVTELTSIKPQSAEAFEKWRTGYASAYAIILFVTVFGNLASIYVKALNKV